MNPSEAARDGEVGRRLLDRVRSYAGPPVTLMEVCGTHTVAIARLGLRTLLPPSVRLLSGPGCPVCVTPAGTFDDARRLVADGRITLATYGDALRVPGASGTLADARSSGADVRVVYSALDALALAEREPGREVVFLGLGFETTAPTVAQVVELARSARRGNFSVLSAHKALLPAMEALVRDQQVAVGAFLCPGHASMVLGVGGYEALALRDGIPCVIAGFEANDILVALSKLLAQVAAGTAKVENAYPRAVRAEGNPVARRVLDRVFERADAEWRGLGTLPGSGYELREDYESFDARKRYLEGQRLVAPEPAGCRCADVLRGRLPPEGCALFGEPCTPDTPVGACMVSSEGACGAWFRYGTRP